MKRLTKKIVNFFVKKIEKKNIDWRPIFEKNNRNSINRFSFHEKTMKTFLILLRPHKNKKHVNEKKQRRKKKWLFEKKILWWKTKPWKWKTMNNEKIFHHFFQIFFNLKINFVVFLVLRKDNSLMKTRFRNVLKILTNCFRGNMIVRMNVMNMNVYNNYINFYDDILYDLWVDLMQLTHNHIK